MKQMIRLTAVSMAAALCFSAAKAEDKVTPKPEDAEKNAFQTQTTGKQDAKGSSDQTKSHANPESRLNDDPPAHEKVGTSNNPGK